MKFKGWELGKDRVLAMNYPGAKSVIDAVQMARGKTLKPSKEIPTKDENKEKYEAMREAIISIANEFSSVSSLIKEQETKSINQMPLTSVEEIKAWQEKWLGLIRERSWNSGVQTEQIQSSKDGGRVSE